MTSKKELALKHFGTTDFQKLFDFAYKKVGQGKFLKDCVKPELFFGFPAPGIPTPADVEKGEFLSKQQDKFLIRHVIRVGDFAVKVGYRASAFLEVENLLWLQKHATDLEQPKIHAFYCVDNFDPLRKGPDWKKHKCYYLVMDYIKGDTLSAAWPRLSQNQRDDAMNRLAAQFKALRSVSQPDPCYYGRIERQGIIPNTPMIRNPQASWGGPYGYYTELVEAMETSMQFSAVASSYCMELEFKEWTSAIVAGFRDKLLDCSKQLQQPVLTHIDAKAENILVCENGRVVIIDWETLAWLPKWAQWWSIRDRFSTGDEDYNVRMEWLINELGGEGDTLHKYLQSDCCVASYTLM